MKPDSLCVETIAKCTETVWWNTVIVQKSKTTVLKVRTKKS